MKNGVFFKFSSRFMSGDTSPSFVPGQSFLSTPAAGPRGLELWVALLEQLDSLEEQRRFSPEEMRRL